MLKSFRNLFRRSTPADTGTRAYSAANTSRLSMDWIASPLSPDAAVSGRLPLLRERSREMERNNEWARGFFRALENNVIGHMGIALQVRIQEPGGRMDEVANQIIETAWWRWGKVGRCTLDKRKSWRDVQRIVIRMVARDGEAIIRKVRTRDGLRLQLLEPDLLDFDYNVQLGNGNEVRYGVEINQTTREVLAYHLLSAHPGEAAPMVAPGRHRVRIPAEEIIHLFLVEREGQTRGVPWLSASAKSLKMLDGYTEAELVAARAGAAKMGFFTKNTPEGWTGEIDGDGNLSMDASPGAIEELPQGVDFKAWPNDHPNSGFGDFVKSILRGTASANGISYTTLSSDLEGVNYSSIRAGLLEEREGWKALQQLMIEHLCEPVFSAWLELELLRPGGIALPITKLWKFDVPEFRGRRWPWVDPLKDVDAAIKRVQAGFTSQSFEIAEQGGDAFDTFTAQQADKQMAATMGLSFPALDPPAKPGPAPGPPVKN